MLENREFQLKWKALYEECPWATPFQSFGFVATWYQIYKNRFNPIMLSEFSSDGELIGLLTLAVSMDTIQLVLAGAHQAEYQVWLASPLNGNSFIEKVMKRLHADIPNRSLVFKYLPPLTPTDWTVPDRPWEQYCQLESHRRPLLIIGDGSKLAASLSKKSNKSRLNRLKQLGNVSFEQIHQPTDLGLIFDEIIACYDFRQCAVNGSALFQKDPLKK